MLYESLLVTSYAVLGGGIKAIDEAFDGRAFSKRLALIISIPMTCLMGYWMLIDPFSATIFLSILLSVLTTKKLDNGVFFITGLMLITFALVLSLCGIIEVIWVYVPLLFVSGYLDEVMNDSSERRKGVLKQFMYYRPLMKIAVISLVVFRWMPFIYLIAFILFDMGYAVVEGIANKRIK